MRTSTLKTYERIYDRLCDYVNGHYMHDVSVDDAACFANTSRRQAQRVLKHYGLEFRKMMIHKRMTIAAQMLERTDWTVQLISMQVAYNQPAQFAKAFRKQFGVTPTEYRRRHRNGR